MKKKSRKVKRFFVFGLICIALDTYIVYSYANTWNQIYLKNEEKENLVIELNNLKEENEELKSTSDKLHDPEYMAKYAREKRLYAGKDEYIIRIK